MGAGDDALREDRPAGQRVWATGVDYLPEWLMDSSGSALRRLPVFETENHWKAFARTHRGHWILFVEPESIRSTYFRPYFHADNDLTLTLRRKIPGLQAGPLDLQPYAYLARVL